MSMGRILCKCCIAIAFLFFVALQVRAQGTLEDYQRAQKFLPGNARHLFTSGDVMPHWIEKTDRFWYRSTGPKGSEFILVDAEQNTSNPAFDHARLAEGLSHAAKQSYDASKLPFDTFDFVDKGKGVHFEIEGTQWTCNLDSYECKRGEQPAASEQYEASSPDGRWAAYVENHNLLLRDITTGTIVQLTRDGEAGWDYATPIPSLRPMVAQGTEEVKERPAVF